jgi:hypothetical protein
VGVVEDSITQAAEAARAPKVSIQPHALMEEVAF